MKRKRGNQKRELIYSKEAAKIVVSSLLENQSRSSSEVARDINCKSTIV